jgi:AmmeMemoRadiSam system protein A
VNISKIAHKSIEDEFNYQNSIDIEKLTKENPLLKENGASFITLIKNGKLRGCIGSLEAKRPLIEDIIANAKNAAFRDPRFSKLTHKELDIIEIEVSILTKPKLLEYTDIKELKTQIRPNIDGVIVKLNSNQATFLPQVWEELPEFEDFFGHLLNKANLPMDSFINHPEIYIYQIQKFN